MFNNKNTQCVKYLYSQVMSLYCIKLITVPVYIAFDCYRTISLVLEQKNTTMTFNTRILMQAKLSAYEYLTIVRFISIKMLPHCYQNWRQNWVDKNAEKNHLRHSFQLAQKYQITANVRFFIRFLVFLDVCLREHLPPISVSKNY